jgi:flavorubredoxin
MLSQGLEDAGFALLDDGLRTLWVPDEKALAACFAYGQEIASLAK